MADYLIRWKSNGQTVDVELIDTIGPVNTYEFSDKNAVLPFRGDFTNQMNQAVPTVSGWVMNGFDNAKNYPANGSEEDKGTGNVDITHVGTFPQGQFNWEVIKKL